MRHSVSDTTCGKRKRNFRCKFRRMILVYSLYYLAMNLSDTKKPHAPYDVRLDTTKQNRVASVGPVEEDRREESKSLTHRPRG